MLKRLLRGLARAVLALPCSALAAAPWPTHSVTIVVPSSPGDGADLIARIFAEKLQQAFGPAFIVENRTGAGGIIGSAYVARARPDGYTLILGNAGSHGINAATYPRLAYNPQTDFTPISEVYQSANVFVAGKKLPVHTLPELISYIKHHPNTLNYGSGGVSSSAHMSTAYLSMLTGIEALHVPYKGATEALTALVGGQVDFMAVNLPPAASFIRNRQVTPLAVTTRTRSPMFPDIPTVQEAGIKDFETVAWFGFFAPAATAPEIVDRLSTEIRKICRMPDVKTKLLALGGELNCDGSQAFAAFQRKEIGNWIKVAKFANISLSTTN
jgi:tripartite-type tricarboxylate transporter receptor subunit TctC